MKQKPLLIYLVIVAVMSVGFVIGMKVLSKSAQYLSGPYMFIPAIAALITRIFFYRPRFADAYLQLGKLSDYLRFWAITMSVVLFSYFIYTLLGAITWDISGETFLNQLKAQMDLSGQPIDHLPDGITPKMMLVLFFIGGLTIFNIPMIIVGFGEEFGWRGFMFPQLCRSHLWGGFIIGGIIWFLWHVPLVLIMPTTMTVSLWQNVCNGIVLVIGSICSFIFFAYVYARSGSIWVVSLSHAVFNNGSRSFSYFAKVEDQLLANFGLMMTMLIVLVVMYFRKNLRLFKPFLNDPHRLTTG